MATDRYLKSRSILIRAVGFLISAGGILCVEPCHALPQLAGVVNGSAELNYVDAQTLDISASDKAILNYASFDIAESETVNFILPSAQSEILNRVTGSSASTILGRLFCNGILFLINPNGITFGPAAQVDVGSIVASTRDITDSDFISSNYIFERLSSIEHDRLLLNQGQITIREGGFGVLIAGAVENQGVVIAPMGTIAMAGGDLVRFDIAGNGLISIAVDRPTAETIYDVEGQPVTTQLKNSGTLEADGGVVILKAESVPGLFEKAINLDGYVRARSVEGTDGKVVLSSNAVMEMNTAAESPVLEVERTAGDFYFERSESDTEGMITLEGGGVRIMYVSGATLVLGAGGAIDAVAGAIIRAHQLQLTARQFGRVESPLHLLAEKITIKRSIGSIDILESLGIGTSILLRGPPEGFGALIYNAETSLVLQAGKTTLAGNDPAYLFGNLTFWNFELTVPGKIIYFEAGQTFSFAGSLHIEGVPGYDGLIKLFSSSIHSLWHVDFTEALNPLIAYVAVRDANNLGTPVKARPSTNWGNSWNWDTDPVWDGGGWNPNWSNASNWDTDTVPTESDDVTFDATSHEDAVVDIGFAGTINSLTINGYTGTITLQRSLTVNATYSQTNGTMDLNGQAFNVTGDLTLIGGVLSCGNSTVTLSGDVDLSGGTVLAGTSTLVMTVGYDTLIGGDKTLYNLTLNGYTYLSTSDVSVSNTLSLTQAVDILSGRTLTLNDGATTTLGANGVFTGAGTVQFVDSAGAGLASTGMIRCNTRFTSDTSPVTVPARYYYGSVELYNNSGSDYTFTLGTAGGQTVFFGSLYPMAENTGNVEVDAATFNPTVTIANDLDFKGTGAGTESISMGSGTWTVGGNVDLSGGTVACGTSTLVMDASGFSNFGTGASGTVYAMTVYNNELVVGGNFTQIDGVAYSFIARWNGSSWSSLGSGTNGRVNALCVYNDELYAGGTFFTAGGVPANEIAKWDGISWAAVGNGIQNGYVSALAVFNTSLIAGGSFTEAGGSAGNRIAGWDGANWSALGSGMDDTVNGLCVYDNTLIAVGRFGTAGGVACTRVAQWNGANWSDIGGTAGGNNIVEACIVHDNDLYIGGIFTSADGVPANMIARWNGANWSAVGGGLSSAVATLATYNGELIAGGYFSAAGATTLNYLGRWDGSSWSRLSSGTNGTVYSLGVYGGDLYFGGTFSQTGIPTRNIGVMDNSATLTLNGQALYNFTALSSWKPDREIVLADAVSIQADLTLSASSDGDITLDASICNPSVTIGDDLDFTGAGSGNEIILAGSGTWSVAGDFDLSGGTFTAGTGTLSLSGSADQNLDLGTNSLYNFDISNNLGTIIVASHITLSVGGMCALSGGSTLLLQDYTLTVPTNIANNGLITTTGTGANIVITPVSVGAFEFVNNGSSLPGHTYSFLTLYDGGTAQGAITADDLNVLAANTLAMGDYNLSVNNNLSNVRLITVGSGTVTVPDSNVGAFTFTEFNTIPAATYTTLTLNNAAAIFTAAGAITAEDLALTSGIFDIAAHTLTVPNSVTGSGTILASGNGSNLVLTPASVGSIHFTNNATLLPAKTYATLTLDNGGTASGAVTATTLNLNAGILDIGGNTLTVTALTNDGTILTSGNGSNLALTPASVGSARFTNTASLLPAKSYATLTLDAGGTATGPFSATDFILNGGEFIAPAETLSVYGDFTNSGIFTANGGTVDFVGSAASTITGDTNFCNFNCTTAGKQLLFEDGSTQTVEGVLTLEGISGNSLVLESVSGARWYIDPQGEVSTKHLRVSYAENIGPNIIYTVGGVFTDCIRWVASLAETLTATEIAQLTPEADIPSVIPDNIPDVSLGDSPALIEIATEELIADTQSSQQDAPAGLEGGIMEEAHADTLGGFDYSLIYEEEDKKYKKQYVSGKYRTVVIVFEGAVAVAPYNSQGAIKEQEELVRANEQVSREHVLDDAETD